MIGRPQSERVYFELINGTEVNLLSVIWNWIKHDQPLAWNYHEQSMKLKQWQCSDGDMSTKPELPSECYPKPSIKHAMKVIKKTFNVGMKRVGKDVCPVHSALDARIQELTLNSSNHSNSNSNSNASVQSEIDELKSLIIDHEKRANDCYDMIHHSKQQCCYKTYKRKKWPMIINQKTMMYPERAIHLEFDYDHCRHELLLREQDYHYKSPVNITAMSIVHKPFGRLSILWSELFGGKNTDGVISALNKVFKHYSFGASHVVLSSDGASTQVNQGLIKWLHWITCHKNPSRLFLSISWLIYVNGHNYNEADNIGHQFDECTDKKTNFYTASDRVKFVNKGTPTNFVVYELRELQSLPEKFNELYSDLSKWKDQHGYNFQVRNDKACVIQFGQCRVWKENQYHILNDNTDVIVRASTDWKVDVCRINIIKKNIDIEEFEWESVVQGISKPPAIKKKKLLDTRYLIKTFCGDKQTELLEYYTPKEVDNTEEKEQDKVNRKYQYYVTMVKRANVLEAVCRTGEKQELPQYDSGKKRQISQSVSPGKKAKTCGVEEKLDIEELRISKGKKGYPKADMVTECIEHNLAVSGGKEVIAKRIMNHYNDYHNVSDDQNDDDM